MSRSKSRDPNDLMSVPGVGPKSAADLISLGIRSTADLRGKDPERLYADLCKRTGTKVDRCMLYVFRCAVYYASTDDHDPALLKWWSWKDDRPTGRSRGKSTARIRWKYTGQRRKTVSNLPPDARA